MVYVCDEQHLVDQAIKLCVAFLKHCNNRAGLSIATLPSFLPTFKFEQGWYPCVTFTPLTAIHPTLYQLVYGGLAELIFLCCHLPDHGGFEPESSRYFGHRSGVNFISLRRVGWAEGVTHDDRSLFSTGWVGCDACLLASNRQ